MHEYLYTEKNADEPRDLLREIDAGELDERYLIKHASDYGRYAVSHPFSTLKTTIASLLSPTLQTLRRKHIAKPLETISHSITR